MSRCGLCNGRLIQTEFGTRCMNKQCDNATVDKKEGHTCLVCNTTLEFKRNNAYGDRAYWCPVCHKEFTL